MGLPGCLGKEECKSVSYAKVNSGRYELMICLNVYKKTIEF